MQQAALGCQKIVSCLPLLVDMPKILRSFSAINKIHNLINSHDVFPLSLQLLSLTCCICISACLLGNEKNRLNNSSGRCWKKVWLFSLLFNTKNRTKMRQQAPERHKQNNWFELNWVFRHIFPFCYRFCRKKAAKEKKFWSAVSCLSLSLKRLLLFLNTFSSYYKYGH